MASKKEIDRRIRSINNTRQITRAMELVAATKMRKAQQAVQAARPYAEKAEELLRAAAGNQVDTLAQPLLQARPVKKTLIIVFGSDRGLCGGLNASTIKAALELGVELSGSVSFATVGKKVQQGLRARGAQIEATFTDLPDVAHYEDIRPVATYAIEEFLSGWVDAVQVLYPQFVSTLVNKPELLKLLPVEVETQPQQGLHAQTVFEPSPEAVLDELVPRVIETELFQARLEEVASEHSARMVAMRNATSNAGDLLDALKFSYNQARQAAITTEIAEIAAGSAMAAQ